MDGIENIIKLFRLTNVDGVQMAIDLNHFYKTEQFRYVEYEPRTLVRTPDNIYFGETLEPIYIANRK